MAQTIIKVGVIVARTPSPSAWAESAWRVQGLLPDPEERAAWSELRREENSIVYFAGIADIEFHISETGNYRDNLSSAQPLLWVVLRPCEKLPGLELAIVTADPGEGEAMTGVGDLLVEALPMPATISERLAAFVEENYVERPFVKRLRD